VIAVTAIDQNSSIFQEANRGDYIDFAAPGVRIWAPGGGNFGQYLTGTSFATPFVAAMATLAVAKDRPADLASLTEELAAHSEHLGPPGKNPIYGYGLVKAVSGCRTSTASVL
jgi:subtilisin family serine protease